MITELDVRWSFFRWVHEQIEDVYVLPTFFNEPLTALDNQRMLTLNRYFRVTMEPVSLEPDATANVAFHLFTRRQVAAASGLSDPAGTTIRETAHQIRFALLHANTYRNLIALYQYSTALFSITTLVQNTTAITWETVLQTNPRAIAERGIIYSDPNRVVPNFDQDPLEINWSGVLHIWTPENMRGEMGVA
jgi:hypothetical protein